MAGRENPRDDASRCWHVIFTDTPADYDCLTGTGSPGGFAACGVEVGTAGDLVVQKMDGNYEKIPSSIFTANAYFKAQFIAVVAEVVVGEDTLTTTAQDVVVFW
jgi:hypothetical protein